MVYINAGVFSEFYRPFCYHFGFFGTRQHTFHFRPIRLHRVLFLLDHVQFFVPLSLWILVYPFVLAWGGVVHSPLGGTD